MRNHVDGSAVNQLEYINAQAKLIAKFSVGMLNTGPEQYQISGEEWKALDRMSHNGMQIPKEMMKICGNNDYLSYLTTQWVNRYAHIFGHLAAAEIPLEVIESEVEIFQHAAVEHIANIRHLWQERVHQCLALQSTWEQAVNIQPEVVDYNDGLGVTEPYYKAVTLFPHLISKEDADGKMHHNLLLANGSVHPEILMMPIREQYREAVEKDISTYSQAT